MRGQDDVNVTTTNVQYQWSSVTTQVLRGKSRYTAVYEYKCIGNLDKNPSCTKRNISLVTIYHDNICRHKKMKQDQTSQTNKT